MPLYQLVCLARHYREYYPIKELVTNTVETVLKNGGVVRKVDYYGHQHLPDYIGRGASKAKDTDQWTMHFDSNPMALQKLSKKLRNDPRILRHTVVKLGTTFKSVTESPNGEHDPTLTFSHIQPPSRTNKQEQQDSLSTASSSSSASASANPTLASMSSAFKATNSTNSQ